MLGDLRGGVEKAQVDALLNDLPDGGLGQGAEVYLPWVLLLGISPVNNDSLHLHLDEAVVGDLVDGGSNDGIEDA